jgi:hypothetical protein
MSTKIKEQLKKDAKQDQRQGQRVSGIAPKRKKNTGKAEVHG